MINITPAWLDGLSSRGVNRLIKISNERFRGEHDTVGSEGSRLSLSSKEDFCRDILGRNRPFDEKFYGVGLGVNPGGKTSDEIFTWLGLPTYRENLKLKARKTARNDIEKAIALLEGFNYTVTLPKETP